MDLKEIRKIIQLMNEHELSYFHLEENGVNIKLKKGSDLVPIAQASPIPLPSNLPAPQQTQEAPTTSSESSGKEITAPMVGTFYTAASPEAKPFVKPGDKVKEGQTLCIIEAMKVMNEIKAESSGTITEIIAKDGEAVQFGDTLFFVK